MNAQKGNSMNIKTKIPVISEIGYSRFTKMSLKCFCIEFLNDGKLVTCLNKYVFVCLVRMAGCTVVGAKANQHGCQCLLTFSMDDKATEHRQRETGETQHHTGPSIFIDSSSLAHPPPLFSSSGIIIDFWSPW